MRRIANSSECFFESWWNFRIAICLSLNQRCPEPTKQLTSGVDDYYLSEFFAELLSLQILTEAVQFTSMLRKAYSFAVTRS